MWRNFRVGRALAMNVAIQPRAAADSPNNYAAVAFSPSLKPFVRALGLRLRKLKWLP